MAGINIDAASVAAAAAAGMANANGMYTPELVTAISQINAAQPVSSAPVVTVAGGAAAPAGGKVVVNKAAAAAAAPIKKKHSGDPWGQAKNMTDEQATVPQPSSGEEVLTQNNQLLVVEVRNFGETNDGKKGPKHFMCPVVFQRVSISP